MTKLAKNVLMKRASGKFGDQVVFRQKDGQTIIAAPPGKRTKELTEGRLKQQQKFKMAVIYAMSAMQDPEKKAAYKAVARNGRSGT